jgi:hypothetical protein
MYSVQSTTPCFANRRVASHAVPSGKKGEEGKKHNPFIPFIPFGFCEAKNGTDCFAKERVALQRNRTERSKEQGEEKARKQKK